MSRGARVLRAVFVGLAAWLFVGQPVAVALLVLLTRADIPAELVLVVAFGGPALLAVVAAVWAYRRIPDDGLSDADEVWAIPDEPSPGATTRRRRGPRSRRSRGP